MIWPFSRDRQKDSDGAEDNEGADRDAGRPAAATVSSPGSARGASSVPAEPKPLLNQDWDPMEAFGPRDGAARNLGPGAMEEPTYARPRAAAPRPASKPVARPQGPSSQAAASQSVRSQPVPGWRGVLPERPGEGTAGGVVLPGGVMAGGLRPPGPSATPDDIEAFLHAVRAMHRIDSGHLAGVMPRARAAEPIPPVASVQRSGSVVTDARLNSTPGQPMLQGSVADAFIAPRDVDAQGLPRESRSGRWYLPGTPIVMARGLVAAAGSRRLLPVDLTLSAGERWGILGANGAGKTTLLRTLAGLHAPVTGVLEWSGVGSAKLNALAWAKHCAFLPTVVPEPFDETVRSRVARIGSLGARVDAALLAMGLAEFADRRWSTLSSGERQRAWVAFALASDADALLLDEPLAHQDPRERLRLADAFAAEAGQGRLVVITAHDPDWVLGHCTHAIVIAVDGSAAHGPVDRILQPQILAAAYAVPWRRVVVDGRHALVAGR